ncbi:MAG: patatin-like phospholipase family protein [Holosporaceae bacterium]|jgi:patatin-like phospholipase/acyl hydrolase|nr:patatin-like phospholipase family protein [Holosporaceae bacterium]
MEVKHFVLTACLSCAISLASATDWFREDSENTNKYIPMVELQSNLPSLSPPLTLPIHDRLLYSDSSVTSLDADDGKLAKLRDLLKNHKVARIASFDGGGIKGIILASLMAAFEEKVGKSVAESFHMEIGTSTGGLVTALLTLPDEINPNVPRYTAKEVLDIYVNRGAKVFKKMSFFQRLCCGFRDKYSSEPLDKMAKDIFGDVKMHQLVGDVILTYYDMQKGSAEFLKSSFARDYEELIRRSSEVLSPSVPPSSLSFGTLPSALSSVAEYSLPSSQSLPLVNFNSAILDKRHNFYVKDCAISTSSAPSYFAPYKLRTVKQIMDSSKNFVTALDGGIGVNHPYLCGITEAVSLYPNADAFLVMSFGTGENDRVSVKKVPTSIFSWATELPDMFMGGESKMAFHVLKTLGAIYNREIYFARIQMKLPPEHMAMDDLSESNVEYLKNAAIDFANQEGSVMDMVCSALREVEKTPRHELAKVPEQPRTSNFIHIGKVKS